MPDLHSMLVRRAAVSGDSLKIKLYTYGRSVERDLPLATLLEYYNGYVGARYPELQCATHMSNRCTLESNKF
jgi:hypothetical protein